MENYQARLGSRLRAARTAAGLTQEQVANFIGLPRTAIVQMEAGNRAVSTQELSQFAQLCKVPASGFFDDAPTLKEEDAVVALFRAAGGVVGSSQWHPEVLKYLSICREGVQLAEYLGYPPPKGPPAHFLPKPERTVDAVEQGAMVAEEERRRLGIAYHPVADMSDLINGQNIWASGAKLPDAMSGLFLRHSSVGMCILVNFDHNRARKRFSYAHEYAHALMDRDHSAIVSLKQDRGDLSEVRANAFAACFLMPRGGVWAFLNGRFKGGPSVVDQTVYDPSAERDGEEVRAQRRSIPGSQELTFEDVAALAHHFGVSYLAALYRLKSLLIVHGAEFNELKSKEAYGDMYLSIYQPFSGTADSDPGKSDREVVMQVLHLAIEAYRRGITSKGKLRSLGQLLGVPEEKLIELAEAAKEP